MCLLSSNPRHELGLTIVLNDSIAPGFAATATAHASLAYFLKHRDAQGLSREAPLQFAPQSIRWASVQEFECAKRKEDGVVLTESALGNREVAVVHRTSPLAALAENRVSSCEHNRERRDTGLKMYILVRNDLPLEQVLPICATASVACYQRYEDYPSMQLWVSGAFRKVVCKVNEKEFSKAMAVDNGITVTNAAGDSAVGLAFCPRDDWPKMFRYLRLFG